MILRVLVSIAGIDRSPDAPLYAHSRSAFKARCGSIELLRGELATLGEDPRQLRRLLGGDGFLPTRQERPVEGVHLLGLEPFEGAEFHRSTFPSNALDHPKPLRPEAPTAVTASSPVRVTVGPSHVSAVMTNACASFHAMKRLTR